jgi:outer membrane protein OmpA-like peptidoglycan-associated protein
MATAMSVRAEDPLKISIDRSKVDLKQHRLEMVASREVAKVNIKVLDEAGTVLDEHDTAFPGEPAGATLSLTWTPSSEAPVAKIEIRAFDNTGHWAGVVIWQWSVSIPHKDVVFKTGSAQIDDAEKSKLEESFTKIADALTKYKDIGPIALFIAGHTDTVGSQADNLRLSRARARAIAAWFKTRGLPIPIAFEGFGVYALLVKTGDNVDEPRNRRVDYFLAVSEPAVATTGGFRPSWQQLK